VTALVDTSVLVRSLPLDLGAVADGWVVSAITIGELEAGVLLATDGATRAARLRRLAAILSAAPALTVDAAVAARYGELRAATGRLPSNDLWIAATALAHDLTLVTGDERQGSLPLIRAHVVA
jgi:predicted nucleic acid-binding protein